MPAVLTAGKSESIMANSCKPHLDQLVVGVQTHDCTAAGRVTTAVTGLVSTALAGLQERCSGINCRQSAQQMDVPVACLPL